MRDLRVYSSKNEGKLSYYHDRYNLEADCVLHLKDGRYALIEFKLGNREIDEGSRHLLKIKQLVKEYIELLSSPGNASDHFWELEKRIKKDKKHPGVLIELRKSTAIWDIAYFVGNEIITMDDLAGFSEDLIYAVKLILSR